MEGANKSFFKSSRFYWLLFLTLSLLIGGFFYFETMKPDIDWELGREIYRSGLQHSLKDLQLEKREDTTVVIDEKNKIKVTIDNDKEKISVIRDDSKEGFTLNFNGNSEGVNIFLTKKNILNSSLREYVLNRIKKFKGERNGIVESIFDTGKSDLGLFIITKEEQGPYPVYYNLYLEISESKVILLSGYSLETIKYILENLSLLNK